MQLVIVDTAQIQTYIFGSNKLRENLGASYLVAQSTEDWARECLPAERAGEIEKDETQQVEELYAGGGNAVFLFRATEDAKEFTRKLSQKIIRDAPNLSLLIASSRVRWENSEKDDSLFGKVNETFQKLATQKRERASSFGLQGLGITVNCQSTGLPAAKWVVPIEEDPESGYPASAEIIAKLNAVKAANTELEGKFKQQLGNNLEFPYDLDNLGRSEGNFSHIAVVHADGDGMSQRFRNVGECFKRADQNRDYIKAVRGLSRDVRQNSTAALAAIVEKLIGAIDLKTHTITYRNDAGQLVAEIQLKQNEKNKKWWLPFRPIVFGGDDVTFVCDGRLGLALAAEFLKEFVGQNKNLQDGANGQLITRGATACAGAAIVKTHYPFARAYALAEDLCQSAKAHRAASGDTACLDWHFALSGLAGGIDEIRAREYKTRFGELVMRPVVTDTGKTPALGSWQATEKWTRKFQSQEWMERRNKVKAFRDALRQGAEAVKRFRTIYGIRALPGDVVVSGGFNGTFQEDGWVTQVVAGQEISRAAYFDALELADWYVPLEK